MLIQEKYFQKTPEFFIPFDSAHSSYNYCFVDSDTTNSEGEILQGSYFLKFLYI